MLSLFFILAIIGNILAITGDIWAIIDRFVISLVGIPRIPLGLWLLKLLLRKQQQLLRLVVSCKLGESSEGNEESKRDSSRSDISFSLRSSMYGKAPSILTSFFTAASEQLIE